MNLEVLVDVGGKAAIFRIVEDGRELSRHDTIFDTALWLDGYRRGTSREESRDRSVC